MRGGTERGTIRPDTLMLVSAHADAALRDDVSHSRRPCPEFLRLEQRHGARLCDLSALRGTPGRRTPGHRTPGRSLRHVLAATHLLGSAEAVLSDGEHVGIPMALMMRMRMRRDRIPHVVIGHHLTTSAKVAAFRLLGADHGMTRILVHSTAQRDAAVARLGVGQDLIRVVPYGIDLDFWRPRAVPEEALIEPLILAPGREHRDLTTLAAAARGVRGRVVITGFSPHSPRARTDQPREWPPNVIVGPVDLLTLRTLYARAAVVVVPLLETDFPAGITTVLEAMAMGRPVVVSATTGLAGIIDHGRTGMLVAPGDPVGLATTVARLLGDPGERARLGAAARRAAEQRFSLDGFVDRIAAELRQARESTRGWPGERSTNGLDAKTTRSAA